MSYDEIVAKDKRIDELWGQGKTITEACEDLWAGEYKVTTSYVISRFTMLDQELQLHRAKEYHKTED